MPSTDDDQNPERPQAAILEMQGQVGDLVFDESGLACRGLLVRYLVMPDELEETGLILRWVYDARCRRTRT